MTALHWNGGPTGKPYPGSRMNVSTVADDKWLIDCSENASLTALNSGCLLKPPPPPWYNHTHHSYNESSHAWHSEGILLAVDIKEWLHVHCFPVFFFRRLSSFGHFKFEISAVGNAVVSFPDHLTNTITTPSAQLGAMHFTSRLYFSSTDQCHTLLAGAFTKYWNGKIQINDRLPEQLCHLCFRPLAATRVG